MSLQGENLLILAMDDLEELTSCIVCSEEYDDKRHIPKGLPCMHTLCIICANKLTRSHVLECPECRRRHTVQGEDARSLPTNVTVMRLMTAQSKSDSQKREVGMRRELRSLASMLKDCEKNWKEQLEQAQIHANRLEENAAHLREKVDAEVEKWVRAIRERQDCLNDDINAVVRQRNLELSGQFHVKLEKLAEYKMKIDSLLRQKRIKTEEFNSCTMVQPDLIESQPNVKLPHSEYLTLEFPDSISLEKIFEFGTLRLNMGDDHGNVYSTEVANHNATSFAENKKLRHQRKSSSKTNRRHTALSKRNSSPLPQPVICRPHHDITSKLHPERVFPISQTNTSFRKPTMVSATPADTLILVTPNDRTLEVIDLLGNPMNAYLTASGDYANQINLSSVPADFVVSKQGNYVVLLSAYPKCTLEVLNSQAKVLAKTQAEASCTAIAVDDRGSVYTIKKTFVIKDPKVYVTFYDRDLKRVLGNVEISSNMVRRHMIDESPLSMEVMRDKLVFTTRNHVFIGSLDGSVDHVIDASLYRRGSSADSTKGLVKVMCVEDVIYVGDNIDNVVHMFSMTGSHIHTISVTHDLLSFTIDSNGDILVMCNDKMIYVF